MMTLDVEIYLPEAKSSFFPVLRGHWGKRQTKVYSLCVWFFRVGKSKVPKLHSYSFMTHEVCMIL